MNRFKSHLRDYIHALIYLGFLLFYFLGQSAFAQVIIPIEVLGTPGQTSESRSFSLTQNQVNSARMSIN